jgi:excisionase family DNA binding protein
MPKTRKRGTEGLGRRRIDVEPFSTGDVARRCGVSRAGVLHWIRAGSLVAFRTPGGHFRIRPEDLGAFLRRSSRRHAALTRPGEGHILVVDDDGNIRQLLRDLLQGAGYRVQTAAAAEEALESILETAPDLVITDLALPGEGGAALTRALRTDPSLAQVPVIAVTGQDGEERLREVSRAGADLLVRKPFDLDHLLAEIRRLLAPPAGELPLLPLTGPELDEGQEP